MNVTIYSWSIRSGTFYASEATRYLSALETAATCHAHLVSRSLPSGN
jgi:hypothetical protein